LASRCITARFANTAGAPSTPATPPDVQVAIACTRRHHNMKPMYVATRLIDRDQAVVKISRCHRRSIDLGIRRPAVDSNGPYAPSLLSFDIETDAKATQFSRSRLQ
jgi:hypothetical protein